ncbi:MAG: hypothetical protein M1833_004393 [Piccolia ochrophora]|nr:MAG: hypothetical protein M1833_004393 [Piccolia ochrophora]
MPNIPTLSLSTQTPRRFAAEPVETSSTERRQKVHTEIPEAAKDDNSSRHGSPSNPQEESKPRRFQPEPLETVTRSKRDHTKLSPPPGNAKGLLGKEQSKEQSVPPYVESSIPDIQSKQEETAKFYGKQPGESLSQGPVRKFKVEELETTTKSRRKPQRASENESADNDELGVPGSAPKDEGKPARRFKPEPIETVTKSSKETARIQDSESAQAENGPPTPQGGVSRRKFAPQLVETTKRKRKSGDSGPAVRVSDKTDVSPGDQHLDRRNINHLQLDTAHLSFDQDDHSIPSFDGQGHRQYRLLGTSPTRSHSAARQHSFVVPALEPIESSESDESKCPSLSTSPSISDKSSVSAKRLDKSTDEMMSGHLLEVASRAAEKQLREQAMAAFPNDDFHEPVDHYAVDRDSEVSDTESDALLSERYQGPTRRDSAAEADLAFAEMRRHAKRGGLGSGRRPSRANIHAPTQKSAAAVANRTTKPPQIIGGWQRDTGLEPMRNAACPPMLGRDLQFPRFLSPQATKLDVDQHPDILLHQSDEGGGLWKGFCVAGDQGMYQDQVASGLHTPRKAPDQEYENVSTAQQKGKLEVSGLDSMLSVEATIDLEFSDDFVTQVYNYLSLGYPTVARKFDSELSKISNISTSELRGDDDQQDAKGFVGLAEGSGAAKDVVINGKCARWKALRLYIREWARQHPDMGGAGFGLDAWGVRARRGSWAF